MPQLLSQSLTPANPIPCRLIWLHQSAKSWELTTNRKTLWIEQFSVQCRKRFAQRPVFGRKKTSARTIFRPASANQMQKHGDAVRCIKFELALVHSLDLSLPFLTITTALVLFHKQWLSHSCTLPFSSHARPSFSSLYPVLQAHAKLPSVLTQICAHLWPPDVLLHSSISVKKIVWTIPCGVPSKYKQMVKLNGTLWNQVILSG